MLVFLMGKSLKVAAALLPILVKRSSTLVNVVPFQNQDIVIMELYQEVLLILHVPRKAQMIAFTEIRTIIQQLF